MMVRVIVSLMVTISLVACGAPVPTAAPAATAVPTAVAVGAAPPANLKVLAAETFLADIAQNVAGDRLVVESLIPIGVDPHGFQPAPADVARVAESTVLIVNGAGFEEFLDELLANAGGERTVIAASDGLTMRTPTEGEVPADEHGHGDEEPKEGEGEHQDDAHGHEGDPHFWLDPISVVTYVENIRKGLSAVDPAGAAIYAANAAAYTAQLQALDAEIRAQVEQIPAADRKLVTNHESFGYYADRYGFQIVGTIVPSVSPSASPSAQELAELVEHVRSANAKAVFLETGTNPQLAEQLAAETGMMVVSDLFTHSVSAADGPAPTYLAMIRYNTQKIVDALTS